MYIDEVLILTSYTTVLSFFKQISMHTVNDICYLACTAIYCGANNTLQLLLLEFFMLNLTISLMS